MDRDKPEQHDELSSIAPIEDSHNQLKSQIKEAMDERDALKLITKNQLKNIIELQEKCEESFIAISTLPENRNAATDRYEEFMTETSKLQNKQFEINELLNLALKEFDESMVQVNNAKEKFNSELITANNRLLIYKSNMKEIKGLADTTITNIRQSTNAKKDLLEKIKKHLSKISLVDLQHKLKCLNEKKLTFDIQYNDIKNQMVELEGQDKKIKEEMTSFEQCMIEKQEELKSGIENLKMELEISDAHLEELQKEIDSVNHNIEKNNNEYEILNNKLNEEKTVLTNLINSEENQTAELNTTKTELENRKLKLIDLKNMVEELSKYQAECLKTGERIKELIKNRDDLLEKCSILRDTLTSLNNDIDNDTTKCNNLLKETDDIDTSVTLLKEKIDLKENEKEDLRKLSEEKIRNISNEINQCSSNNSNLIISIKEKEESITERQKILESLTSELEVKENFLKEKSDNINSKNEELEEKLKGLEEKKLNLTREIQEKKESINEKKKYNEEVKDMQEKINAEKLKYDNLVESSEKEKEEAKLSYNKKIEENIEELEKKKIEKTKEWETVRDNTSKSQFTYYQLKTQAQRLRAEASFLKENLKTYNCENEMLKMFIGWMSSETSASDTDSVISKTTDKLPRVTQEFSDIYSQQSDSSFDETTENEPDEDIIIQSYQNSVKRQSKDSQLEAPKTKNNHFSVSEIPITITETDGTENLTPDDNTLISLKIDQKVELASSDEQASTIINSLLPSDKKKNISDSKPTKRMSDTKKIDGGSSSSESVKMKRPKTPQKKVYTKRARIRTKNNANEIPKKKTILEMVIDSSN